MILYDSKPAPNPRRVRVFLAEKGIEVPVQQVDIGKAESRRPAFLAKNPLGTLPVLELDDGTCIAESVAICRYFEETHPSPPLFGTDARDRALVEMWSRRTELEYWRYVTGCFQNTHKYFADRLEQVPAYGELCRKTARERLAWLDRELAERPFVAGPRYTIADITLLCAIDFGRVVDIRIAPERLGLSAAPGAARPRRRRAIGIRRPAALACLAAWVLCGPASGRERGADGRFEKRSSSHFTLLQDVAIDEAGGFRGARRFEQEVLAELERAYDSLDALLGLRPARPIQVLVYDPGIFDASFGGLFRFAAAGFYAGVIRVRGDVGVTAELAAVLHHELVHAALDQAAPSVRFPGWFNEGLAQWFEQRVAGKRGLAPGEAAYLARARDAGALVPFGALLAPAFSRLDGTSAGLAYLESYAMVAGVARGFGERALRELCVDAVRTGDLERALETRTRLGSAELYARALGAS